MIPYPYHAVASWLVGQAASLARRSRIEQYVFDTGIGQGQAELDLLTAADRLEEAAAELRRTYERIQQTRQDAHMEAAQ